MVASGFCCSGCAYVFRLIHEQGLDAYYRIKDPLTAPADAGVFQPRDYAWLDAAQALAERATGPDATPGLTLGVQGISCAGCVWLIERLFRDEAGGCDIVVNAQLGTMRLRWLGKPFSAANWARRLQSFGYLLGPAGDPSSEVESRGLIRRIGLCAAFALNVMLFTLPGYFGMRSDFEFAGLFRLLALMFSTLSVLVGGSYFIGRAARALRSGAMHIDLPIAMGIVGAYLGSLVGWATGEGRLVYWDFVATFVVLMLVGRWAQVAAVERNRQRLLQLQPVAPAVHLADGTEIQRDELRSGQIMRIESGQALPVEAQLEAGPAAFSLASISGEAEPRLFGAGHRVPAGAVLVDRTPVRLKALQGWSESLLAQLLAPAKRAASRHPTLERVVRGYVVGIVALSLLAGFGWGFMTGDLGRAASVMVAVLVVSCPCAIGLALPLADEMATTALRRRGVFVRDPDLWGKLSQVQNIIFDKTGTLTLETPELLNPEAMTALDESARQELWTLVEGNFHPIAQSLLAQFLAGGGVETATGAVEEEVGRGVRRGAWTLGRAGWQDDGPADGATVLARDRKAVARFRFADSIRPGAAGEIAKLIRGRYRLFILSGDRRDKVAALAAELRLPEPNAVAELTPEEKAIWIANHARDNALMLGDGANDSLAFDRALCRGTPVIHRGILEQKADFYYLRSGIGGIADLLAMARERRKVQWLIIAFSIAYNVSAAGLAVAGWINPLVAAVLMPASSLFSLGLVSVGMRRAVRHATR